MVYKKVYNSCQELQIDASVNRFAIYGDLYDFNNKFESISLSDKGHICGIMYYNTGIDSQILQLDNTSKLLIGFEKWILGIDCLSKKIIVQTKSVAPFNEFLETDYCILSICELDIYAYNSKCELLWSSQFRDVIVEYTKISREKLFVRCSNGDTVILALKNGATL